MKKLSLLLILSMMFTCVFAQKSIDAKAQQATSRLVLPLQLTPEQQVKVKALFVDQFTQKEKLRANRGQSVNKADLAAQQNSMQATFNEGLDAILTPQQIEKRKTMVTKQAQLRTKSKAMDTSARTHTPKAKSNNRNNPEYFAKQAQAATDRMTETLSLTPEQSAQVNALYNDYYLANNTINVQQKGKDRATVRAERVALNETFRTALDAVLTDEQRAIRNQAKTLRR